MKTLKDIEIKDKTFLIRVDYNVPIEDGQVTSDLRIRSSLPTLDYLFENGAKKLILISHLGRPEGKIVPEFSLAPVAETLKTIYEGKRKVIFIDKIAGKEVKDTVSSAPDGSIILLENLRFDPREEENDISLAKEIIEAVSPDFFVQDGFAVIHRAHMSTTSLPSLLPSVAGLLLEKEISNLEKVKTSPEHPLTLIIGGAKVEDKSPLIEKFKNIADHIIIGGKIAADGYTSKENSVYVATDFDEDSEGNKLDVGPLSTSEIAKIIAESRTVVWNGLMGKAEDPAFSTCSTIVAKILGEEKHIFTVICGGDTTGFVENLKEEDKNLEYNLISTGGGASLEYLCDNPLPGLEILK